MRNWITRNEIEKVTMWQNILNISAIRVHRYMLPKKIHMKCEISRIALNVESSLNSSNDAGHLKSIYT